MSAVRREQFIIVILENVSHLKALVILNVRMVILVILKLRGVNLIINVSF